MQSQSCNTPRGVGQNAPAILPPSTRKVYSHFLVNQVPPEWRRRGFASLKPLGSWIKDLRWRVRFFALWLERGNPYAFSLPAFFFPQVLYYVLGVLTWLEMFEGRDPLNSAQNLRTTSGKRPFLTHGSRKMHITTNRLLLYCIAVMPTDLLRVF